MLRSTTGARGQGRRRSQMRWLVQEGKGCLFKATSQTLETSRLRLIRSEPAWGRFDILVLNASGGLEQDKAADYAMQLNLTAQVNLVNGALPLMPSGGRIVFVTSHLAHFYGTAPGYG